MPPGSCGPAVRGLMRFPARRSIGAASWAIVGMLRGSSSSSHCRSGDRLATGNGGASRMSTMTCGGVRYGVCAESAVLLSARQRRERRRIGISERIVGNGNLTMRSASRNQLFERRDKAHDDPLRALWTDTARAMVPDEPLYTEDFRIRDAGSVAVRSR